jgi:hypothetical protein
MLAAEDAARSLAPGLLRRLRLGRLHAVKAVAVPYRLFRVTIRNAGEQQSAVYAIDAVTGMLDLVRLDSEVEPGLPGGTESLGPVVPHELLCARLLERVRRMVYLQGFFRLRGLEIRAEDLGRHLLRPYWVGVYRRGRRVAIEVLDASRGVLEGGKLRDVIAAHLVRRTETQPERHRGTESQ